MPKKAWNKYAKEKAESVAIYHEHSSQYVYHHITDERYNRRLVLNVQKLMKKCSLIVYLDYYNNHRSMAMLKGLPPVILHRQQALTTA